VCKFVESKLNREIVGIEIELCKFVEVK